MTRIFARWWMKRRYVWKELCESALSDLQADLAAQRAKEKRALILQLNKEADAIEERIAEVSVMEEKGFWQCEDGHETTIHDTAQDGSDLCAACRKKPAKYIKRSEMTGQEKYESDKERGEAQKVAEDKRQYAKQQEEEAKGSEDTVKMFRKQAATSREVANRLRKL